MKRIVVPCLIAAAGLRASPASAQPPRAVRLEWIRGPGADACQSREALVQGVSRRLGRQVFTDEARASIEAFVQREGDRWVARIVARDADGKVTGARELVDDASNCRGVDAAVELAMALVIDPNAALGPPPKGPPNGAEVPPPVPPPPPPPAPMLVPRVAECPEVKPCPPATPPPRQGPETTLVPRALDVGPRFVVVGGLLPGVATGGELALSVPASPHVDVAAGALFLPEERTSSGDFGFGLTAARLGVSAAFRPSDRVKLSVGASLLAGAIDAVVYALEPTSPGDRGWAAAEAEGAVELRVVGPVALEVGADLFVPLLRQPFTVAGEAGNVFQESSVAGGGFVGVRAVAP